MPHEKTPQKEQQSLDELLAELPAELREKWERENANEDDNARRASLNRLVEGRRRALKSPRSQFAPRDVEIVKDTPLAIRQMIEQLAGGEHEALGAGQSAKVIASLLNPEIAYKVFFPLTSQPLGTNDLAAEAELQRAIADLGELHGVRAPHVYYFVENTSVRAIAMERLHAVSVEDVLDDRAPLPEAFEYDRFLTALEAYVQELHDRGYYHRDLHAGNILIDRETGMPYVIDFGMSVHAITRDDAYTKEIPISGQMRKMVFNADERMLRDLRKAMLPLSKEDI
jgi:serine/threonine protein kinase